MQGCNDPTSDYRHWVYLECHEHYPVRVCPLKKEKAKPMGPNDQSFWKTVRALNVMQQKLPKTHALHNCHMINRLFQSLNSAPPSQYDSNSNSSKVVVDLGVNSDSCMDYDYDVFMLAELNIVNCIA